MRFHKDSSKCLRRACSSQELLNSRPHRIERPAPDGGRKEGELLLAVEVLTSSFDFGSCFPKSTPRNGFCRAKENIDLVSKLRRLLPGKETRSAEENVERPKTDAFGIKFRRGRTSVKGNVVKRMCIVHLNLLPHL